MIGKNDRPPPWLLKMCGHGKSLDQECMACAMMFRIEERKDAEIVRLRARVQELEAQAEQRARMKMALHQISGAEPTVASEMLRYIAEKALAYRE